MSGDNSGSDGGTAGGSGAASALSLANQVKSTVEDIIKIVNDIVNVTSRSVVCEIDNVCGHTLNFDSDSFDHGGFGPDLPPASVADKANGLFSAGSSGVLVGVEGRVTYIIDDGRGSRFTIHFDNPELGSNSGDCSVDSPIANTYFTRAIIGHGNNGAQMRYILGHLNGPYSLRVFLSNARPIGFDPSASSTSIRALQPPVTSIGALMRV
jgi:hypothetical protein